MAGCAPGLEGPRWDIDEEVNETFCKSGHGCPILGKREGGYGVVDVGERDGDVQVAPGSEFRFDALGWDLVRNAEPDENGPNVLRVQLTVPTSDYNGATWLTGNVEPLVPVRLEALLLARERPSADLWDAPPTEIVLACRRGPREVDGDLGASDTAPG